MHVGKYTNSSSNRLSRLDIIDVAIVALLCCSKGLNLYLFKHAIHLMRNLHMYHITKDLVTISTIELVISEKKVGDL